MAMILVPSNCYRAYGYTEQNRFEKRYYNTIQSIIRAADEIEVPRELVLAICWGESSFRNRGVTHLDGQTMSYGVCQVKLETAEWLDTIYPHVGYKASAKTLHSPYRNALYAAKYLHYQLKRYKGDWKLAVNAYNSGHGRRHKTKYITRFIKNKEHIKKHIVSIPLSEHAEHGEKENEHVNP